MLDGAGERYVHRLRDLGAGGRHVLDTASGRRRGEVLIEPDRRTKRAGAPAGCLVLLSGLAPRLDTTTGTAPPSGRQRDRL